MPVYRVIPTGDLALTGDPSPYAVGIATLAQGGQLVVIEGLEQIRQRIATRLKFFVGEWFLDLRQGVPYYRDVFVSNPNLALIRSLFRRVVLRTPGVISVPRILVGFDPATRQCSVTFQAIVDGGRIEVEPGDEDFLVDLPAAA
jgi:hypothetical protein